MGLYQTASLEVAALSDVGCRRSENEDSYGYSLALQVFVVCDGMGGSAGGEVASRTAVDQLLHEYSALPQAMGLEQRLRAAVLAANDRVWSEAQADAMLAGMGTTLVAACVDADRIVIANVGDSRAYFLRETGCVQITQDHSVQAEQQRMGIMPDGSMAQYITRALGVDSQVEPDLFTAEAQPGDMVLLTTDGMTRYADADELARLIHAPAMDEDSGLPAACNRLIEKAKAAGAVDNVTCLLFRVR